MKTTASPANVGMQVAATRPVDADTVQLTINAKNGTVVLELSRADATGLAKQLTTTE